MKKILIVLLAVTTAVTVFGRPPHGGFHGGRPPMGGFHGGHRPPHGGFHHYYHGGYRGWIAPAVGLAAGAIIGSVLASPPPPPVVQPIVTTPVVQPVITTPVVQPQVTVTPQQIWVPGNYVPSVDANGIVTRTWVPGHWTLR